MGSKPKKPKAPPPPDPKVEAEKAANDAAEKANEAAAKANTEQAARKKRKADSSLLSTAGGARGDLSGSLLSTGKDTLGS